MDTRLEAVEGHVAIAVDICVLQLAVSLEAVAYLIHRLAVHCHALNEVVVALAKETIVNGKKLADVRCIPCEAVEGVDIVDVDLSCVGVCDNLGVVILAVGNLINIAIAPFYSSDTSSMPINVAL